MGLAGRLKRETYFGIPKGSIPKVDGNPPQITYCPHVELFRLPCKQFSLQIHEWDLVLACIYSCFANIMGEIYGGSFRIPIMWILYCCKNVSYNLHNIIKIFRVVILVMDNIQHFKPTYVAISLFPSFIIYMPPKLDCLVYYVQSNSVLWQFFKGGKKKAINSSV